MDHKWWSTEELEKLKPSDLAEIVGNVVLILRRMPNVPVGELQPGEDLDESESEDLDEEG